MAESSEYESPIIAGEFNIYALPGLLGKQDPVILDIGCNDGTHTVAFLKLFPISRVYAFEPDPRAVESFRSRIKGDRVELLDVAISDTDGTANFHVSDGFPPSQEWRDRRPHGWDLSGSIKAPKNHLREFPWCEFKQTIQVQTKRLDTWRQENGIESIDLIWADVQGAEENLISGGLDTLKRTHFFYTEYSNRELYEGQVDLKWIMKTLPNFEIVHRFSDDALLRNKLWK